MSESLADAFKTIEAAGVEEFLTRLRDELVSGTYRPMRNRKQEIPPGCENQPKAGSGCHKLPSRTQPLLGHRPRIELESLSAATLVTFFGGRRHLPVVSIRRAA